MAGSLTTVLLRDDGNAVIFGRNTEGQAEVPERPDGTRYVPGREGGSHRSYSASRVTTHSYSVLEHPKNYMRRSKALTELPKRPQVRQDQPDARPVYVIAQREGGVPRDLTLLRPGGVRSLYHLSGLKPDESIHL